MHSSATISVKFKNKKTGSTYKSAIKIKVTVAAKEAAFSVAETELNLVKGEEKALTVTGKDVTFKSSDEKVATVDATGKVTAVGAGSADINVTCGDKTAKVVVKVVKAKLTAVQQTKADEFVATISGDTEGLAVKDFNFASKKTDVLESIIYPINKITVDAKDKTKVTINTFSRLTDGKVYTLTFDGVSLDITVSDGKVASIVPDTVTIPYNELTQINVQAKDANGVILESSADDGNTSITVTFSDITVPGYTGTKKGELVLVKKDDTAKLAAAWHSNKYDPATGKEIDFVEIKDVVITAVDQALVNNFDMRIGSNTTVAYEKMDKELIAKGTGNYNLAFSIKNEKGKDVKDLSEYSIDTSDKDVFTVANWNSSTKRANLTAYKKGTAFVILKKGTTVVKAFQVDVVDAAKVATMSLSTNALTVSNANVALANATQTTKVDIKLVDQYGKDIKPTEGSLNFEILTIDGKAQTSAVNSGLGVLGATCSLGDRKIEINPMNQTKGVYVFRVTYRDKDVKDVCAQTLTVNVVTPSTDPTATTACAISLDKASVDTTIKTGAEIKDTDVTITITKTTNGILSGVENATIEIKKDGKFIKNFTDKVNGASIRVTDAASAAGTGDGSAAVAGAKVVIPVIRVDSSKNVYKLEAGTYTIKATVGDKTYNNAFVVTDSQATEIPVRVDYNNSNGDKIDSPTTANVLAKTIISGPEGKDIYYNVAGKTPTVKDPVVKGYTMGTDGKSINVTKIVAWVPVKDKNDVTYYVYYELPTAKTFTSDNTATYSVNVDKTPITNGTEVTLKNRVSVPGCTVVSLAAVSDATAGAVTVNDTTAKIDATQTTDVDAGAKITAVCVNDGVKTFVLTVNEIIPMTWTKPADSDFGVVSSGAFAMVAGDTIDAANLVAAPSGVVISDVVMADGTTYNSSYAAYDNDTHIITAVAAGSSDIKVTSFKATKDGISVAITKDLAYTVTVTAAP